jgi:trimethylamine--corrinoid protein Co-methyltransferase
VESGFRRRFKPLEILTEEEVDAIHRGTLDVLQETGALVYNKRALKVFEKAGCDVDFETERVNFPPDLVEECLRKSPSSFHVKARNSKHDLIIGADNVIFFNFPGRDTVDLNTWEPRAPTQKEHTELITVLDALPNVHFLNAYPYFGFSGGIPEVMKEIEGVALRMRNSTKVTVAIANHDIDMFTIRMAEAIGTEIFANPNTSSPLTCYTDQVNACFLAAEYDLPSMIWDGATSGGTAPASLAGAVVVSNAELIPYIVLLQLLKPGARLAVANLVLAQNMRNGAPAFGEIGISLHNVAFNQVWRKYGVPTVCSSCGPTSSKRIDFQSGYQKMMPAILSAISGSSVLQLYSSIYGEITAHPIQAILDDDIAGMIGRFLEGIDVSDDSLAVDLINEVGPIPGDYLGKAHTRRWWKKEQFVPKAADRLTYPEWSKTGKKSCIDYAKERMDEILATHKVDPPLTASQEKDIERILKEAREYYRNKGLITDKEWEAYKKYLKESGRPY